MEQNTILEKVINMRKQFDAIAAAHADDEGFITCIGSALDENECYPQKRIEEDYQRNTESDRLLKIGIVGAVKAGKSSLLNALFFEGKDILPKAATPMTAALTELSYGEECRITVDFFTDDDIQTLSEQAKNYETQLKDLMKKQLEQSEKAWRNNQKRTTSGFNGEPSTEDKQRWQMQAESSAKEKLQTNLFLTGAYQQYHAIKNAQVQRKSESEYFTVSSIEDISGKLEDYVGSKGKYTPFTSKVSITLPIKELKDICVVDTPGFNDPVPSRDDRARKALRECDVVLILSPARQFLSATDKEVMTKITTKNGIRELYLIQSQIDNQLHGQDCTDFALGNLDEAIKFRVSTLNNVVQKNLRDINNDGVFTELINETAKRSFHNSGLCESMAVTIEDYANWDSGRKKAWENLSKHYPDYFSETDKETSKRSLKKLGNIASINGCIQKVKTEKERIFAEKLAGFEKKYHEAAEGAKKEILAYLENREKELQTGDIHKLEGQIKNLEGLYDNLGPLIDDAFIETVFDWYEATKTDYSSHLSMSKDEAKNGILSAQGEETRSWTTGWWLWEKQHSETYTTANLSAIKNSVDDYIAEYNDALPHYLEVEIYRLSKKIVQAVQKVWVEEQSKREPDFAEKNELVKLRNKIRTTIADMKLNYDLEYKGEGFSFDTQNLYFFGGHQNKLEGDTAEECLSQAKNFIGSLNRTFKNMLSDALDDIQNKCKKMNFSKLILDSYLQQLEKTKRDLEQPKLALATFKRMKEEVMRIQV